MVNMAVTNIIPGNLRASISDHVSQFPVALNIVFNASYPKSNNYGKKWPKFDQENFVLDYFSVEWLVFWLHLTQTLKNPIKLSLEIFSLYLTLMHL